MREASPDIETHPILGTLELISRKTGSVVSTFPLDAERVTFGRDYDCDIRIYQPDVSKLHAELLFDGESGVATLVVHGSNGVLHWPSASQSGESQHTPPASIVLADSDTFIIRKKQFRFSYGEAHSQIQAYMSPMVQKTAVATPIKTTPPTPIRRRASHRLSIVPLGKRFVPTPATPRATKVATPGPSRFSTEAEVEELVDVVEGDEGETLYLEKKDEEPKPLFNQPFLTPQPTRNVKPRNTSAVPRTRRLAPQSALNFRQNNESQPELFAEAVASGSAVPAEDDTSDESSSSDEEPLRTSTPSKPVRQPVVTAQMAYSTPRGGADSLRKALLLRSARKAWEESQAQDVDGGIVQGHVETRRRKSSSPGDFSRRKSMPLPKDDDSSSSSGSDESDEDKENMHSGGLKWVYEEQPEGSLDDSDSDRESLDADLSIPGQHVIDFNVAGAELSDSDGEEDEDVSDEDDEYEGDEGSWSPRSEEAVATQHAVNSETDEDEDEALEDDDMIELDNGELAMEEDLIQFENEDLIQFDDGEPAMGGDLIQFDESMAVILPSEAFEAEGVSQDDAESASSDVDDSVESSNSELPAPRPPTPPRARFYTPQPQRTAQRGPGRMSLAGIGGPAVSLATPLRSRDPRREIVPVEIAQPRTPSPEPMPPTTPARKAKTPARTPYTPSAAVLKQRELLATPRTLPAPPASFREPDPTVSVRPLQLLATPSDSRTQHHLMVRATEELDILTTARTPRMTGSDDIQRRVAVLRQATNPHRQSSTPKTAPADRRATVCFTLPQTPSRAPTTPNRAVPLTAGARRRGPVTFNVDRIDEGESESLPPTPTAAVPMLGAAAVEASDDIEVTTDGREEDNVEEDNVEEDNVEEDNVEDDVDPLANVDDAEENDANGQTDVVQPSPPTPPRTRRRSEPRTPSFIGVKELYRVPKPLQTPALLGVRELLQEPKSVPSPDFTGLRDMVRTPAAKSKQRANVAETPVLKHMFHVEQPQSPQLSGVRDMFRVPNVAATPNMKGVKEMFAHKVPKTPAFEGVKEMYDAEEAETSEKQVQETQEQVNEKEEQEQEHQQEEVDEATKLEADETAVDETEPETPVSTKPSPAASTETSPEKPTLRPRSRLPTRKPVSTASASTARKTSARGPSPVKAPARTTRRTVSQPKRDLPTRTTRSKSAAPEPSESESDDEPELEPERAALSAPARMTRARSAALEEEPVPVPAPAPSRNTRKASGAVKPKAKVEPKSAKVEPKTVPKQPAARKAPAPAAKPKPPAKKPTTSSLPRRSPEPASAPARRSRRILTEAEQPTRKPSGSMSAPARTERTKKTAAPADKGKAKAAVLRTATRADKENSATPAPEEVPVATRTRSRK